MSELSGSGSGYMYEPTLNNKQYIIAGPEAREYFFHSPGLKEPMISPEEGPFPVLGNIGSLLAQDPNYSQCITDESVAPPVSGSPNCSSAFVQDQYTKMDTCQDQCVSKFPESIGQKDFGFPSDMSWSDKFTNSHSLHAYQNQRASAEGQGPSEILGTIQWIPRISSNPGTNTAFLDPIPEYQQVGNFLQLPMYENLSRVTYTKFLPVSNTITST
jgi:hypothetical protein